MHRQQTSVFRSLILAILALCFALGAHRTPAQARKGTITGMVSDKSGGVLKGAQISLEPQAQTVASDVLGQFHINDLEPGKYTLTVTYVGFSAFTKEVEVTAGQSVNVDATMEVERQDLQILVTAERPSAEVEAANVERTADNIVQVLPA